jgi:hypothetical protein
MVLVYGAVDTLTYRFCLRAHCWVLRLPDVEAAFQGGCLVAHFV